MHAVRRTVTCILATVAGNALIVSCATADDPIVDGPDISNTLFWVGVITGFAAYMIWPRTPRR